MNANHLREVTEVQDALERERAERGRSADELQQANMDLQSRLKEETLRLTSQIEDLSGRLSESQGECVDLRNGTDEHLAEIRMLKQQVQVEYFP